MKNQLILICLAAMIGLSVSCKKKETEDSAALDEKTKTFNDDGDRYKNASDGANDDVNAAIDQVPSMGRMVRPPVGTFATPCGFTIDSTQLSNKILFLNFDGVTYCGSPSRIRDGQIKVQLTHGAFWGEVGAVLTITYINFKVTYFINNQPHTVNFNGAKTLENVNGHDWLGWLAGTATIKYRERALNITVDFDGGNNAVWNSARLTTWNYNPSTTDITFTAFGDSTVDGHANTDSWGSNRYGYAFTTYYTTSIISDTHCGLWRPTSGELVHHVNGKDYTLTLGVNPDGSAHSGACGYGWKITWTPDGGSTTSKVFIYW
ncbi:hypothetical protein BH11BAC1_BH11BAC1_26880 [soil metagenome]